MSIKQYELIDFITDESFQEWVLNPDSEKTKYWKKQQDLFPEKITLINQAKTFIKGLGYKVEHLNIRDKEELLNIIKAKIKTTQLKEELKIYDDEVIIGHNDVGETFIYSLQNKLNSSNWYRIAATVGGIIFIMAASLFFVLEKQSIDDTLSNTEQKVERLVPKGEKLNLKLPDGSRVTLNSSSKLIFAEKFGDNERRVTLIGEGYFEIVKNPNRPFIVSSGEISTTVLGTSFSIRAYPYDNEIKVAVVSGEVSVRHKSNGSNYHKAPSSTIIEPSEMAVYSKVTETTVKESYDYMDLVAWKDGVIYFKDNNIAEVIEVLEKWYGVEFLVQKKLNMDRDYSGTFKNKPLDVVLEGLGFVFAFEFEIDDSNVILK